MTDTPFRRDNHYVPCGYLKRWASPDGRVWTYRILVPHPAVHQWKPSSPRGVAYHSHLYTRLVAGRETDEVEKWLDSEFEAPAQEAIEKATSHGRLTPDDWERMLRFLAAQDVRTPAWFDEQFKRWDTWLPVFIENTLCESLRKLEEAKRAGQPLPEQKLVNRDGFPLRISTKLEPGEGMGKVGAEILNGRALWLWSMQRALEHTWKELRKHKWTILRPPEGTAWFTSDNPVVRLNYSSPGKYDFGGGWGSPGSEILLPLGPQHLLYTQIGKRPHLRGETMRPVQAELVRRIIAEHAYRMVFALEPDAEVPRLRPRVEDADLFRRDRERWAAWHEQQIAGELDVLGEGGEG